MTLPDWIRQNDRRLWTLYALPGQAAELFRRDTGLRRTARDVAGVLAGLRTYYVLRWDAAPRCHYPHSARFLTARQWSQAIAAYHKVAEQLAPGDPPGFLTRLLAESGCNISREAAAELQRFCTKPTPHLAEAS